MSATHPHTQSPQPHSTTAYTSPGYQTAHMEEPSKQVGSDIVRPRSKPSLFSHLEGTSHMDKVIKAGFQKICDPGTLVAPATWWWWQKGFADRAGIVPRRRPPGNPWDPDGGGDHPAGPGGGGGGEGPRRKLFHAKPDANAYTTLKSNKDFDQLYSVFITKARAQGFYALFDSNYVPLDQESASELRRMNEWFYAVLQKIIKTTKGR
ncbi:hypothetical protein SEMRO_2371_G325230.1 [Seminavis robusta]|uniref:Uncharacterized protein n=1 Tax=Seminavis robusta TaxID=568900 RepID=A0A9N8F0J5_9STRA|nr:hypothetical protein SEMRO_2371_G325230.1 [Seminavis robusta]|eukprot:Sro2371_g325230.1 n/a (207) ;mRNA; f:14008-14628